MLPTTLFSILAIMVTILVVTMGIVLVEFARKEKDSSKPRKIFISVICILIIAMAVLHFGITNGIWDTNEVLHYVTSDGEMYFAEQVIERNGEFWTKDEYGNLTKIDVVQIVRGTEEFPYTGDE